MTKADRRVVTSAHKKHKSKEFTWSKIGDNFLKDFMKAEIFTRVSGLEEYIGHGAYGIVFVCEYTIPEKEKPIRAAIKFIHQEDKDLEVFEGNLVLAELMGTPKPDPENEGHTRNYLMMNRQ